MDNVLLLHKVLLMLQRDCSSCCEECKVKFPCRITDGFNKTASGHFPRHNRHTLSSLISLWKVVLTLLSLDESAHPKSCQLVSLRSFLCQCFFLSLYSYQFSGKSPLITLCVFVCVSLQGDEVLTVIKTKAQWPAWQPLNLWVSLSEH